MYLGLNPVDYVPYSTADGQLDEISPVYILLIFTISKTKCSDLTFLAYRVVQKLSHVIFVRLINSSNIDQFLNFFHFQNQEQEKICNNTITKDYYKFSPDSESEKV